MENFTSIFSLGRGGGRANDTTQGGRNDGNDTRGGRTDGNMGAPTVARRTSVGGNALEDWDDASARIGDDPSAPILGVRFGTPPPPGDRTAADGAAQETIFSLGGGGRQHINDAYRERAASVPPQVITQQWSENHEGGDGPPGGQQNAIGRPDMTATTYSGMATATRKGGLGTPTTIPQELNWQRSVEGDPTKINHWKDVMGNLQEFKAYIFVRQGSCYATVMHSPMKFAAISPATAHLQGRIIGFVGDRTATREPTPILLPQLKTWQWVKETVFTDGPALIKHFGDDPARTGTLWKGEGGDDDSKTELHAPRLLSIPLWLLDRIRQEGRALMPYEILHMVVHHIEEVDTREYTDAWATVAAWCILASQGNTSGESLMSFSIEAITEVEDDYLGRWLEQRLDTTMGPRQQGAVPAVAPYRGGAPGPMSQATFAADIGKGVALGLKALGAPMATGHLQSPTKDGDEKTRYTDDDIAAIMGFSHVHRGDQVQPIWITMNNAKQKNHDVFRRQLLARMTDWAYDRRITIDTGVFLDVETVKAIVDLKFNPGEGVAHLNSAAKGLSILACRARTTGEIERLKEREEALTATEKTRQLDEFLRLQKDQRRAPADNFLELKNNIATFMGLVWVLFGSNCDYYKGLRHVHATMDLRDVMAIKSHFTAEHCRRITWAIIDDGRSYFDNVKTTLDFSSGASVVFPQSFLLDIIRNVRYGILVERANFPNEWLSQRKPNPQEQGQQNSRTQGSGNPGTRGNDRQTQRAPGRGYDQQYGGGQYGGGQQYGGQGYQGTGAQGGGYGGGYFRPNTYQPRDSWNANWTDERHPKIKTMMSAYLDRTNGRVHLAEILGAAGKKQTDLPTLPQYVHPNGRPFLCWTSVLGRCTYRECRFHHQGGHPNPKDITDEFADKVVDTLNKGVISICGTATSGGSPPKKPKVAAEEQQTL